MSAQSEDRPLPPDVRRDLDRAAAGIGRTATTAHPDCTCVVPVIRRNRDGEPVVVHLVDGVSRAACSQHGSESR